VVSFTPRPLYPQERDLVTHWIGDWVGPRAVLDAVVKRKIPSSFFPKICFNIIVPFTPESLKSSADRYQANNPCSVDLMHAIFDFTYL
jgi:hypothetical protein